MFRVQVSQPLDEVDLLQRQLHSVQILGVAGNVGRPELEKSTARIGYVRQCRSVSYRSATQIPRNRLPDHTAFRAQKT